MQLGHSIAEIFNQVVRACSLSKGNSIRPRHMLLCGYLQKYQYHDSAPLIVLISWCLERGHTVQNEVNGCCFIRILRQDPPWFEFMVTFFCTMVCMLKKWRGIFCKKAHKEFKGKVGQMCHRSCSLAWALFTKLYTSSAVSHLNVQLLRLGDWLKGSVERSQHERHFCSLLPSFLLSLLQIFQLCLSVCTSSPDLVLFKKFLQEKKYPTNHPKRHSS